MGFNSVFKGLMFCNFPRRVATTDITNSADSYRVHLLAR